MLKGTSALRLGTILFVASLVGCGSETGDSITQEEASGVLRGQASAPAPDSCANVTEGPLGPQIQEVIQVELVTGEDFRTWVRERAGGLAPVALPEGLSGLLPNELVTICVVSANDMAPPGPPLPDGSPRPPADTVVVATREDGSMTVQTIGRRSSILADLELLPSSS